jgi:RNA:NAD 2'-phosphotransferase (TPT1/KptA family)
MNADLAVQLLLALLAQAGKLGALITRSRTRGTPITDEELDELAGGDDAKRASLQADIERIRAEAGG